MEHHRFSQSSLDKLLNVDDDLCRVAYLALKYSKHDFGITETIRSIERQKQLVAEGKSKTMNSRHLPNANGESEALDIKVYANGGVTWDISYYREVAQAWYRAAIELGVQIEWGGNWRTFIDGPHYQLRK